MSKTLLSQWMDEIVEHSNDGTLLWIKYHNKSGRSRNLSGYDVVFTTYGTVLSEFQAYKRDPFSGSPLFNGEWFRVVLDEAHEIRNKLSQKHEALCNLKAENRWCLTGTPLQNNLNDIYSLVKFLGVEVWKEEYNWFTYINKNKNLDQVEKLVKEILKPLMLRRTKESRDANGKLILDLPRKNSYNIYIKRSEEERAIYDKWSEKYQNAHDLYCIAKKNKKSKNDSESSNNGTPYILLQKLRQRQICNHPSLLYSRREYESKELALTAVKEFLQSKQDIEQHHSIDFIWRKLSNKSMISCANCKRKDIKEPVMLPCSRVFCQRCVESRKECSLCNKVYSRDEVKLFSFDDEDNKELKAWIEPKLKESSKVSHVLKEINAVITRKEKVVVFSQFAEMLDLLGKFLENENVTYRKVDGKVNDKNRKKNIKDFSEQNDIHVLLISLGIGANGLNLVAANNVFLVDPWWNPEVEKQATNRIHRMGQTRPDVNIFHFICSDTVEEEDVEKCKERKKHMSNVFLADQLICELKQPRGSK